MKICYLHSGTWPSNSPSVTFVSYNALALSREFNQCTLVIKRNDDRASGSVFEELFSLSQPPNLQVLGYQPRKFIDSNRMYYHWAEGRIKRLAREEGLDAIVTRATTFLPYLVRLKEQLNIPVYYETHDFFADLSLRTDLNKKNRFRNSRLELKYVPRLSALICLQEAQKKLYQKLFPRLDIAVLRTGLPEITIVPPAERKYITYIGSIERHKGIRVLLQALAGSKSKPPLLLVCGKNQDEINYLNQEAGRFYDASKVKITGWVNKRELHTFLAQTAVGVIPLRDTFFNRYLTSPLKLFDYYSFGIPVLATDLPTTRELIQEGQTGYFFENENHKNLTALVDRLFLDRFELERMIGHVYNRAAQYRWQERARRLRKIIEKHLAER